MTKPVKVILRISISKLSTKLAPEKGSKLKWKCCPLESPLIHQLKLSATEECWIYAKCSIQTSKWDRDRKVLCGGETFNFHTGATFYSASSHMLLICMFRQIFENSQKLLNESFRPEFGLWLSSSVVGGLVRLFFLCTKCPLPIFQETKILSWEDGTLQPK